MDFDLINSSTENALSRAKPGKPRAGRSYDNNVPWLLNTIGGRPTVVALVGLPARGKTLISQKLCRYLTWTKITSRVFHLSEYRKKLASDFPGYEETKPMWAAETELRAKCLELCFHDVKDYLQDPEHGGEIAIYDAANSTRAWRQQWVDFCGANGYDLFFIETITDDKSLIQLYLMGIEDTHPDYAGLTHAEAVDRFEFQIKDYSKSYETMDPQVERNLCFLKIFDAGHRFTVHNMSGYLQSKLVYYLMNIRLPTRDIYLTRHGESMNNVSGKVGGDAHLSPRGIQFANALADHLNGLCIPDIQVWTSHLIRSMQTAGRVNAPVLCWNALKEIDVGIFDGMTYEEIEDKYPLEFERRNADKYHYRYPDGESYDDLVTRLEPVMMEIERTGNLVIICHQAVMRCILAYFLADADTIFDDLPHIEVPLHTLYKLTPLAYSCKVEEITFNVGAVSTQNSTRHLTPAHMPLAC